MKRRSFLKAASGFALASPWNFYSFSSIPAIAQEGRGGEISLIVPGPGGSRSGVAGRILANAMQKELGQQVQVVAVDSPREGYMMLANAPRDGRTYGIVGADMPALNRGIGGSPDTGSISPVAMLSEDPAGIHVRRDAPWRSAGELVASIRSSPGRFKASGAGRHAVWHLSTQRWMAAAKAGSNALPWDAAPSAAAAAEALAAGGPDVVVCSIPEVRATPFAARIRTLAVMRGTRHSRYPEVAALSESNVRLQAGWWRGVAGPRGLDPQHVARMQAALQRVNASAAYRSEMTRRGFSLAWAGTSQFARHIASEDQATAAAIRGLG